MPEFVAPYWFAEGLGQMPEHFTLACGEHDRSRTIPKATAFKVKSVLPEMHPSWRGYGLDTAQKAGDT